MAASLPLLRCAASTITELLDACVAAAAGAAAVETLEADAARSLAADAADTAADAPERAESESRRRRCSSARMSEACWKRRLRSFSSARLITSSSFGGK